MLPIDDYQNNDLWTESLAKNAFLQFDRLDEKLSSILKNIPWDDQNKNTWSPEIASVLYDAGSLFSSMTLTHITNGALPDDEVIIENKTITVRNITMKDIRNTLLKMHLEENNGVFCYKTRSIIRPIVGVETPWWKAFTALKHDYLMNVRQATIERAIEACAACYLFLVSMPQRSFNKELKLRGAMKYGNTEYYPSVTERESNRAYWIDLGECFGSSGCYQGGIPRNIVEVKKINSLGISAKFDAIRE